MAAAGSSDGRLAPHGWFVFYPAAPRASVLEPGEDEVTCPRKGGNITAAAACCAMQRADGCYCPFAAPLHPPSGAGKGGPDVGAADRRRRPDVYCVCGEGPLDRRSRSGRCRKCCGAFNGLHGDYSRRDGKKRVKGDGGP